MKYQSLMIQTVRSEIKDVGICFFHTVGYIFVCFCRAVPRVVIFGGWGRIITSPFG